jgi:hypothetical protein
MRWLLGTAFLLILPPCFAADDIPPVDMGGTPPVYGAPMYRGPVYGGPVLPAYRGYGGPVYGGPVYPRYPPIVAMVDPCIVDPCTVDPWMVYRQSTSRIRDVFLSPLAFSCPLFLPLTSGL